MGKNRHFKKNGEKMKSENEKIISLTNGIYRKIGNEIKNKILATDESIANSYSLLIRGNSINDLTVDVTQRGYYTEKEYKYDFKLSCEPLFDYVPEKFLHLNWTYTKFYKHVEKRKLRAYILKELTDVITDYVNGDGINE